MDNHCNNIENCEWWWCKQNKKCFLHEIASRHRRLLPEVNLVNPVPQKGRQLSKKQLLLNKSNGICYLCNENLELNRFTTDHVIPISKGGRRELNNEMPVHGECNSIKDDKILGKDIPLEGMHDYFRRERELCRKKKRLKRKMPMLNKQFQKEQKQGGLAKNMLFKDWLKLQNIKS